MKEQLIGQRFISLNGRGCVVGIGGGDIDVLETVVVHCHSTAYMGNSLAQNERERTTFEYRLLKSVFVKPCVGGLEEM